MQDCEVSIEIDSAPLVTVLLIEDLMQSEVLKIASDIRSNDFVYGQHVVLEGILFFSLHQMNLKDYGK